MSYYIKVKNIEEFKKVMQEKQDKLKEKIPESVKDATLVLHGEIKKSIAHGTNAPVAVDTGRFLNSIDFDSQGENESRVFTDIEYAKFIEFGTSKMQERPHFRNTLLVTEEAIKEVFKNSIKFAVE
jgi:HK97 gp10 family phage protein